MWSADYSCVNINNLCPVCGYPDLDRPAYEGTYKGGVPSYEICPSCGFQYGFTDHSKHITHEQWRAQWITKGMLWDKGRSSPPPSWNPREQLLNIGVKV